MAPRMPHVEGVKHRYESVNGIRLHYAEAGEGEPLVLLHGWPQHWWMWRDLIGPLAERFHVVVPDLRGHGWSDKPESSYLKTELADDLLELTSMLGFDHFRLVGHDWGGWVGMLAALREPRRIDRLVVLSIPHPWPRRRDPRMIVRLWYQGILAGPAGRIAMQRMGLARRVLSGGRAVGSYSDEELAVYDEIFRDADAASATVHLYRSFLLRELPAAITGGLSKSRLRVPTLWIMGERDPVGRPDDGFRDNADDMTLEVIPRAGHFLPEEMPRTVLDRVEPFL